MQINEKNRHLFPIVLAFGIGLSIFLAVFLIREIVQKKNYIEVDAVVTKIERRTPKTGSYMLEYSTYITYTYFYDGIQYTSERKELTAIGKEEGQSLTVKCSADEPQNLEDVYLFPILIVGLILSLVMVLALVVMIWTHTSREN